MAGGTHQECNPRVPKQDTFSSGSEVKQGLSVGLPGHQPGLNNLVQSLVCEELPGVLSSKPFVQDLPPHGVPTVPRLWCLRSVGAKATLCCWPAAPSGQEGQEGQKGVSLHPDRATQESFLLFLVCPRPPNQGGRESSRSKSEKQRSLISFSLPCASPGAGLYFLSSVIISVSHLIIKTLNHLLFLSRLCLERPFVPTQRGRYFYVI